PRAEASRRDAGGGPMNPRAIVEAALFSAGKALTPEELAQTTRLEPDVIRSHLRALAQEYTKRESAIEVAQIGTKWTMQIRSAFAERARGYAPPENDRDLLETGRVLAVHKPRRRRRRTRPTPPARRPRRQQLRSLRTPAPPHTPPRRAHPPPLNDRSAAHKLRPPATTQRLGGGAEAFPPRQRSHPQFSGYLR